MSTAQISGSQVWLVYTTCAGIDSSGIDVVGEQLCCGDCVCWALGAGWGAWSCSHHWACRLQHHAPSKFDRRMAFD